MKIVSGSSNRPLAEAIATHLGVPLVDVELSRFANGEKRVWVKENLRGENVILVQSFSQPEDQPITEFLLLADALERLGVRHINFVMPWMGYSLQDKVFREGEPIAAKVIANIVSNSYIKRAFLLDLHNSSTPGFFSIPTSHLSAMDLFVEYAKTQFKNEKLLVSSPDFGGLKRARMFADLLGCDLVNIDKHRDLESGDVTAFGYSGVNVKDKTVILLDDCIVSGGTAIAAAELLKKSGAGAVHCFVSHLLPVAGIQEKLQASPLTSIVTTNSIHHKELSKKVKVIDVSSLFAEALKVWM